MTQGIHSLACVTSQHLGREMRNRVRPDHRHQARFQAQSRPRAHLATAPHPAKWLSPDPIGEAGGLNLYGYVDNSPMNRLDPLGLDAITIGPVTIPLGFEPGTPQAYKDAEAAHEKQHRTDFWNGRRFCLPKWQIEQRGFEASIPVLEKGLEDPSLAPEDRKYLEDRLEEAKNIARDEEMARAYADDYADRQKRPQAFFGDDGQLYGP